MECGGNIVCAVRAPLHLGHVVPFRPNRECEVPRNSGFFAFFNAADRLSAARTGGRRHRSADLPSRVCSSAGGEWFSLQSNRSVGRCFPSFSDSCSPRWARRDCLMMARAEKAEEDGTGTEGETPEVANNEEAPEVSNVGPPTIIKKSAFLITPDFLVQVAIFILAAGFVDAGFSGDWSRIGVLSKHTEEELQMAAVGVVPLAATLIWSISKRNKNF